MNYDIWYKESSRGRWETFMTDLLVPPSLADRIALSLVENDLVVDAVAVPAGQDWS